MLSEFRDKLNKDMIYMENIK